MAEQIVSIGELMLMSGSDVSRVEDSIRRMCTSLGATHTEVFSITSAIIVSIYFDDRPPITQTRRVRSMSYNLTRIEQLNALSREIVSKAGTTEALNAAELRGRIAKIERDHEYNWKYRIIFYAIVSSSFSVFFGGTVLDAFSAAVIGGLICIFEHFVNYFDINKFIGSFVISLFGGVLAYLFVHAGFGDSFDRISIGNIMVLIPGLSFTNGLRDMFAGDTITGLTRTIEASLLAMIIALGFILAGSLFSAVI
ncbi:MAG: threonine/serine exporter family protein [Eubacteriales bacterium]|nr:threonine/serine exporter family protein [Eubacteriales bacterium]